MEHVERQEEREDELRADADKLDQQGDELQDQSERLDERIGEVREEFERKQQAEDVPGAQAEDGHSDPPNDDSQED